MRLKDIIIPVFSVIVLIVSGCLEMEVDSQPAHGVVSSTFSATTEVVFIKNIDIEVTDDRAMLYAVHKPTGWTIDSVTYTSPEHGNGVFTYLGNAADEADDNPAGIDTGWEDSLEAAYPADAGMHWQVYVSDQDTTSTSSEADPDTFHITVNYTVDALEGDYMLKYWTTHSNNGDAADTANTASAGRLFTAYDPSTSPLVTFTLTDETWNNHNVKFKGSMSDWNLFPGFDDGTNGDATADDHVWTAQFAIVEDGTYEWGAIEDDGSEWGIWLIEGDNPSFTVSGTTVTGTTSYTIPASTTTTPGAITFTLTDGTASYLDVEYKGTATDWAVVQMYDDGTNGDETASDHIWTVIITDITAGDHEWGAIENDGSEWGIWLIDGSNPAYTLDADLTTYHGQTHYEIPEPSGGDPAVVTFTVNDNSWLLSGVMIKGTMSNWAVFQAYDDGMNGDATADDHIWTGQYTTEQGDHEWGAISTTNGDGTVCELCDGSDGWGTWLMEGFPNPAFTLSGETVTGVVDWVIAPDSAEAAGSVMFTVTDLHSPDGSESYVDVEWKGTPTEWELVQMYDDGTNGDETAGDHVWTVIVDNVTAGDHQWGAIENDGTEWGIWLMEGVPNPAFTLDEDLLTLHGATDFVIQPPAGGDVTKAVLFSCDMTEWLDEEGNNGMAIFSLARGDSLRVHGSFNNWQNCTDCAMTRTPGTNIFSHAINVTAQVNSDHQFAYYMQLSQASLDSLEARYGVAPVDWMGWETSPMELGNRKFNLGVDDGSGLLELDQASFYDVFPGSVLEQGESMDLTFSIDMEAAAELGFVATEDSVYLRTHDKWLNYIQGYSDGQDINHYGAEMNEDGDYSITLTLNGPQPWSIYYKWGFKDVSEGSEVDETGGGLGGIPRIRYFHRDENDDCNWPSSYEFPLDELFAVVETQNAEPWDSDELCTDLSGEEEMLVNASFEHYTPQDNGWQNHADGWETYPDGDHYSVELDGSNVYGSDSIFYTYDGNAAAKMWGNDAENNLFQTFWDGSLAPGTQYYVDGMLYQPTDDHMNDGSHLVLFAKYFTGDWGWVGMDSSEHFTTADSFNTWQYRWLRFTVPEGASIVQVGAMYTGGGGAVYLDDFAMWPTSGGILWDGGFEEDDLWSWYIWPDGATNYSHEMTGNNIYGSDAVFEAFEGDYGFKMWGQYNGAAENYSSVGQWFEVGIDGLEIGSHPVLSGWMMSHADDWIGQGINSAYLAFYYYDYDYNMTGPGWEISDVVGSTNESSTWLNREVIGTVPEGTVSVWAGMEYYQNASDGGSIYLDGLHMEMGELSGIDDNLPGQFKLLGNFPNPFNPSTAISFITPGAMDINVNIYNILGQRIASINGGMLKSGTHNIIWNGKDSMGRSLSSGIYFYEVEAGNKFHKIKKMTLLK